MFVFSFVFLVVTPPFPSFLILSHAEWKRARWIHVWMADKPAGSVEQSDQICLFARRQCGTLAMTTGAGLDIYLVCVDL